MKDDLLFIVAASFIGAVAGCLAFTFFLFLLETIGRVL